MVRPAFTTEFLLREMLTALGAPMEQSTHDSPPTDSFSEEMSEESESQTLLGAASGRVMMVRRTNSAQRTVTLVDRQFDVEAFIPRHVIQFLQQNRGYNTLGRLRGSVVRVDKYHFTTLARCLSGDEQSNQKSVSRPVINRNSARVYMWVDALSVVDDNELAVNPQPEVYSNPLVKERLQQLSDAELEKVLVIQQSLPPMTRDTDAGGHFDDDRPLLEEDCVIPEDQEQQLEEQDGWGPHTTVERQPTDSELIEENGWVPISQSQTWGEPQSQTQRSAPVDLSATLSDDVDVRPTLDSQKYPFQQENIRETFVIDSGSDTENEEDEDEETKKSESNELKSPVHIKTSPNGKHSPTSPTPPPKMPATQSSCVIVDLTEDSPVKSVRLRRVSQLMQDKMQSQTQTQSETQTQTDFPTQTQTQTDFPIQTQSETQTQTQTDFPTQTQTQMLNGASNLSEETQNDGLSPSSSPRYLARSEQSLPESETQMPAESRTKSNSYVGGFLRRLASNLGLAAVPADNHHQDKQTATQEEKSEKCSHQMQLSYSSDEEEKSAQPDNFMSSQATVILEYPVDDDDDDTNAFEYDRDVLSDDIVSSKHASPKRDQAASTVDNPVDVDMSSNDEELVVAFTPPKKMSSPTKEHTNGAELKTPSPSSIRTATPGTEKRVTSASRKTPIVPTPSVADSARDNNPVPPPNSKERVSSTDPTATLSSTKSPSKVVVLAEHAVDNPNQQQATRSLSPTAPRGSKRPRQQACPSTTITFQQEGFSHTPRPQVHNAPEERSNTRTHKRHRLEEAPRTTLSPQLERPVASSLPLRGRRLERGDASTCSYSLNTLCQSLGSYVRDQLSDQGPTRSSRQPQRTWKRYENLFPPLNMDRLKRMMTETPKQNLDNRSSEM